MLTIRFEYCDAAEAAASDFTCMSQEQANEWLRDNQVYIGMYQTEARIDLAAKENYFQTSFDYMNLVEHLKYDSHATRYSRIQINEVEMHDTVFNPLDSVTDGMTYLEVASTQL